MDEEWKTVARGIQSDGILKEAAKEGSEVDPLCITRPEMQLKEGDVRASRAFAAAYGTHYYTRLTGMQLKESDIRAPAHW